MSTHDYKKFAKAYSQLEIADTFYLAYRDIPTLIEESGVTGKRALDLGCGTGRSSRFLETLGFETIGVDISAEMLEEARRINPRGTYRLVPSGDLGVFADGTFDLVFSVAVFLEIPSKESMLQVTRELHRVLKPNGVAIAVTGAWEGYTSDCLSFLCDFPENAHLKSGDTAKVVIRNTDIVLYDYVWTHEDYLESFEEAGLVVEQILKPLATGDEPFGWYCETETPIWTTYLSRK